MITILGKSTATSKTPYEFGAINIGNSICVLGTIVTAITIEQPLVDDPDVDNDAHWQQMTTDGTAWQLDSNNTILKIDASLGIVRFVKTGSDDVGIYITW